LLANYYDGSFALNAIAFEMGRRMDLESTPTNKFVNLYINNQYMGIYQLTSQIQSHKGRVDLKEKKGGWLAEFDYHSPASDECSSWFTANKYSLTTFIKSPELDDTVPNRPASYLDFVKKDINNLVDKMSENGFPENGYRELIDLESYAKYVLIELVLDNADFNSKFQSNQEPGSNYLYRVDSSKTTKIKGGPLWDFDLGAGVTNDMTFRHYKNFNGPAIPTQAFYKRLWEDPVFKAKYKKTWDKHKSDFTSMSKVIDSIKILLDGNVQNNKWNGGDLNSQSFNTEVEGLKTWLTNRIQYVDDQLRNIDVSKDIPDPEPPKTSVAFNPGKAANGLSVVKNAIKINSDANASIKVFSINGTVVRKRTLPAGDHTVRLGDLPRGMYLVRVNSNGIKQTVKMAIR